MPFEYSDWNEKWFSPVCRGWFKHSRDNPKHGTLSDLYLFASGEEQYGLSQCMPILKKATGEPEFFGTLCVDINPIDEVSNYFPMNRDQRSRSLIFNSDETFEDASRRAYFLGFDLIGDSFRDLTNSTFYDRMNTMVQQIVDLNYHGFKMTIKEMEIEADKSLLFNDDWITWGQMELESRRRDNSTDTFVEYYTKFLNSDDPEALEAF